MSTPEARPSLRSIVQRPAGSLLLALLTCALAACSAGPDAPIAGPADRRAALTAQADRVSVDAGGRLRVAPSSADAASGHAIALDAVLPRAETLYAAGRRAEVLEHLLDAVAAHGALEQPSRLPPRAWSLLATQLERAGARAAAGAVFELLVEQYPEGEHRAERAWFFARGRDFEAAAEAWRAVLAAAAPGTVSNTAINTALEREAERGLVAALRLGESGEALPPELIDGLPEPLRTLAATGAPPRARVTTLDAATASGRFTIGPPIRIDDGGSGEAAEPSVAVAGDAVIVGWNDERDPDDSGRWRLGVGVSTDGGATWDEGLFVDPVPPAQDGDPMTASDPRTGDLWIGAVRFTDDRQVYVAHRPPGGPLGPPVTLNSGSGFDKSWMDAGPPPGNPAATRLYVAYSFPMALQRSSDFGATWSTPLALDAEGLAFQPRVGPGGELTIGYFEYDGMVGDEMRLQRSLDGGMSVGAPRLAALRMDVWDLQDGSRAPGDFRLPTIPTWAVDPGDGTLYLAYYDTTDIVDQQANLDVYVARSDDDGATWTTPTVIHGDGTPPGDQFFPWIEVADDGTLHVLFFDGRHTIQDDDVEDGRFDVYYATSTDRGASWTEIRLTEAPFGTGGLDWPFRPQFLGDYLGLTFVDGDVLAVYPKATGADLDLFAQRIASNLVFADGFEAGDTTAWTASVP